MIPRKHIKFICRDAHDNLLETPQEFVDLAELWNTHDEVGGDIEVLVIDEAENPDEREDDDADNGPLGDEP